MKIFFTLFVLLAMSVNAQIVDTVKVMNIHSKYDYVEKTEVSNISQIKINDEWMYIINKKSYFIDDIDYVDFSDRVYHDKINITPEIYKKDFTEDEVIEAIDHLIQNGYLDYRTLSHLVGDMILNNYIYNY